LAAGTQAQSEKEVSRRRLPRFEMQAPLDVTVLRSGIPDTVPGRMVNLNERGIAAVMASELAAGETVGVELQLPMVTDPLRARALVKYQDKLRCGMEFVGFTAEQQAAIRDWAKAAKVESEKDVSEEPEVKAPEPAVPEANVSLSKTKAKETKKPDTKADAGVAEKSSAEKVAVEKAAPKAADSPAPKASAAREAAIKAADLKNAGFKEAGLKEAKRSLRFGPLATILILILFWSVIGLAIFWWRWNRSWAELESGLDSENTTAVEKPQAQVSAEVMERLVIHRVEPVYPAEARQSNLQGIIALDIVVGKDGSVVSMHALNGPDVLARAAMDALRWWKFAPYRINGESAVVETTVAVEFKK
jgi:TonB family protein